MYRVAKTKIVFMAVFLALGLPVLGLAAGQTIVVAALPAAPVLDGRGDDWEGVAAQSIPVSGPLAVSSVRVKTGIHGERVFFLFQWADPQADTEHKPFVWDAEAGRYVAGPQREDRFAVQFAMAGDYDVDWLSGNSFKADMWHWKAARSNPLGLAHDKMTIIGLQPIRKTYKAQTEDGRPLYIQRTSDAGGKLYTTKRYRRYEQDTMPKYMLNKGVSGSVADVQAKGVWKDGQWTLELQRKLDTGHVDDVAFVPGRMVRGGIAVFERSGDDRHNISGNLMFQF